MQRNNLETFTSNRNGVSQPQPSFREKKIKGKKKKEGKKQQTPPFFWKREASDSWHGSLHCSLHQSTLKKTFLVPLPNKAMKTYCQCWSKILGTVICFYSMCNSKALERKYCFEIKRLHFPRKSSIFFLSFLSVFLFKQEIRKSVRKNILKMCFHPSQYHPTLKNTSECFTRG